MYYDAFMFTYILHAQTKRTCIYVYKIREMPVAWCNVVLIKINLCVMLDSAIIY